MWRHIRTVVNFDTLWRGFEVYSYLLQATGMVVTPGGQR